MSIKPCDFVAKSVRRELAASRVFAYVECRVFCKVEFIMSQSKTLKQKIRNRVARTRRTDVFLPRDFADLSGEDQVLRALRSLVRDGALVRLGYGVYARAMRSRISGHVMVASSNGFHSAALSGPRQTWRAMGAERQYKSL